MSREFLFLFLLIISFKQNETLLDIKDEKAPFIIELLKNFKYVKAKPLTPYKAEVLEGLKQAVEEMKLIKEGKLKGIPAKNLLDEL